MASWAVRRDRDAVVVIDVVGDQITIDVPAGVPFTADVATAEEIQRFLGAAIGAAQQQRNLS